MKLNLDPCKAEQAGPRVVGYFVPSERQYFYDAYSNEILEVTPLEAAFLRLLVNGEPTGALIQSLAPKWPEVPRIAEEFADFRRRRSEQNVLQPMSPSPVEVFGDPRDIRSLEHQLENHLQTLILEVTAECSYRCKYCIFGGGYEHQRPHSGAWMSPETVRKALDFFLPRTGCIKEPLGLSFYGGEPLLAIDLIERVVSIIERRLDRSRFALHMTTNGLALNKERIRSFLAEKDVSLTVSLDGPQATHDAWRVLPKGEPTHALVQRGLQSLLDEHPDYYARNVRFNAVVTNPRKIDEVVDYFSANEFFLKSTKSLRLSPLESKGLPNDATAGESSPQLERDGPSLRERFIASRSREGAGDDALEDLFLTDLVRIAQRRTGPAPTALRPQGYCVPGARKLFVSTEGSLGMCEKVNSAVPIGTLDGGFDIDRIASILRELTRLWRPDCKLCYAQRFCGVCPAHVWVNGPRPVPKLFDDACQGTLARFAANLRTYVSLCERSPRYAKYLQEEVVLT